MLSFFKNIKIQNNKKNKNYMDKGTKNTMEKKYKRPNNFLIVWGPNN